ncbi:MAG: peptidoglycan D,D-transpeptidase FtsI family protein [Dethiobacteria bacterium]|jgi:penicillin-binding protein 2
MWRVKGQQRVFFLFIMISCLFLCLIMRLTYVQIIKSYYYAEQAVKQRSQRIIINSGRGDILDRKGVSLLDSRSEEILVIFPSHIRDIRGRKEVLSEKLPMVSGREQILNPPYETLPFIAARGLSEEEAALLASEPEMGLIVSSKVQRYGSESLASHVVGHLHSSDFTRGEKGIEFFFNEELQAQRPESIIALVDARDRLIAGLGYRYWQNTDRLRPYSVMLTIDRDIQKEVEEILDKHHFLGGSAVVMEPQTGNILAMASRPDYDQNRIEDYLNDNEGGPFNNRSTMAYEPGSIFKIVVAAAALEQGIVNIFDKFQCNGSITVGSHTIRCNMLHPSRELNLIEAFAYSCNSVFVELGLRLGAEVLYDYAKIFGFGEKTGIPLGEESGYIPQPEELYIAENLAATSIGQFNVQVTPLQVARLLSIVARGGKDISPRLVESLLSREGHRIKYFPVRSGSQLLKPSTVNQLIYLLDAVTDFGTGQVYFADFDTAGKTGTAQTGRYRDHKNIYNCWFAGFFPLDTRKAVVVVFVESHSLISTAEIFREIAEAIAEFL